MTLARIKPTYRLGCEFRGVGGPAVIHNRQQFKVRAADLHYLGQRGLFFTKSITEMHIADIVAARGGDTNAIARLKALQIQLSDLGEIGEIKIGEKTYEVVLGLETSPIIREMLAPSLDAGSCLIRSNNQLQIMAGENNVSGVNKIIRIETGLCLRLPNNDESERIKQTYGSNLEGKDIFWFWANDPWGGREINSFNVVVRYDYSFPADDSASVETRELYPDWSSRGGTVLIKVES